ncbi:hypothetical protein LTLLF_190070 [Microtus ochrogaster]|uniref:Coiled-coil domain containing 187 n=1 Tax=Microtus ochrogaster TaxID=79684 RepID=A0A8J6KLN8_MICOH|nr:hypothetical protein LTLLF_190070 [Microtus ochrogaster]
MPTSAMGVLPTFRRVTWQTCPRDSQQEGLYSPKASGRMASRKATIKPREEEFHPHTAKDSFLKWPLLSQKLGTLGASPSVAWSDCIKEPSPYMKTCSLPVWSPCLDTRDANSSVSSGRLSGSSGGHDSCALFHGPWKERPPLVLGPQRQPRKSNPRLEQLRDKIRAQAQWQASCASLGTSVPSSASCLYKTSSTGFRRKTPRMTNDLPVAACPDSELTGVYAWRKGQALVRRLLGPPPALSRLQSKAPATELGSDKEAGTVGDTSVHTWFSKLPCARGDQQVSEHTPNLAFHDQSGTIQGAIEILQDLRQQIQTGLELARRPRVARKLSSSKPKPQNLAGKSQQGLQNPWDIQASPKSAWTATEGKCSSLGRAGNLQSQQHWKKAAAEQESCPQRAWAAQGQHTSFQRPGNTPEKPGSFSQRPWSAVAWQTSPQRAWENLGQDPSFQRSGSPPKKSGPFSQRPWSALASQACSQRTYTAGTDWEVPGYSPWSSVARVHPVLQQPWSSASVQSPYSKEKSAGLPPSKVKPAWPEPAQDFPQSKPAKEQDTLETPPCPRPRQPLGQPRNSESLRDFMRRKAQARRQQAMEQKTLAAHTLELRNQRLQELYRKQREAILGKAVPVVSQRSPGIVTFVPSSVQSEDLEAPGSLGSPLQKWSKVTSGMVLGNQEAPDRFCSLLVHQGLLTFPLSSTVTQLQDLPGGLCVYLDPQDTEHPGPSGLPHFQYKQARLQALETMADVLKQRIDILTTKLHKSSSPDTAGDLASDMPPLGPSTAPTTSTLTPPSYLRSLVSDGSRGTPQDWVDTQGKPLLPSTYVQDSPSWKPLSSNLGTHIESQPQGAIEERHRELEKKLQREMATLQALGACMRRLCFPFCCPQLHDQAESAEVGPSPLLHRHLVMGQQEPKGPHSGGHLTSFQLKSLHFLQSLKLDQQKQEQALALLRQRAEQEVWETQMALDELVFKHQLKILSLQQQMEKPLVQQKPEKALKLEQQQTCGGLEPSTPSSFNTVTTKSRCLGLKGREAAWATLWEKQQQALSRLEKERREIQYLKKVYASLHRDRKQLLQHQQSILDVQRSVAHLRQELQARNQRLQSSSSSVKVAWEGVSDTHQKTEEHGPGSPQSHNPQELSDSLKVSDLSPEQKEVTPPQATSAADKLLQPQTLKWAGVTPGTGSPSVESGHDSQGSPEQIIAQSVSADLLWLLDSHHDSPSILLTQVEKDGNPVSQLKPQEAKELLLPGHLQTKPSAAWVVERQPTDSHAWSLHGPCGETLSEEAREFQKATATLVHLSNSSISLSSLEAEDTLHADPSWSRELSAHDSWEKPGLPAFWGPQGLPQLEGAPGDVGPVTLQKLEGMGIRLLSGFSEEAGVAGDLEPGYNLLQAGWPLSFPRAPSPRLGSELSESSSQIWDENNEENLEEPSPGVEPPSGSSLPARGSLDMEDNGASYATHTSPGSGEEQEASRTCRSPTGTSNTGKTMQISPVATFTVLPHQTPFTNDSTLPLSFCLDMSTSEKTDPSKENMPPEEPQDADTGPFIQKKPLQALPDPKATMTPKAPSEDKAPLVTEVASPSYIEGFLTEILSPVDEALSYGSGDLPSSIHRDAHLPPPPPTPQAKSDINEPNPSSEDFPSPPEEAMFPGDSLDTLGEDMSITAEDMSSLSEGALEEALFQGPQKSGHCLGASGHGGSLDDSSSIPPLSNWVVGAPEMSPGLSAQPLSPSPMACAARENLTEASGSQGRPWEAVRCSEGAEHQQGIEHLLDRRAATSSPPWFGPSESPPGGPVPLVVSGQAESLKHTSAKTEGQSCWIENQPMLQDLLDRQQLYRRDWAFGPASGACVDFPGTGDAGPLDVVSTQLSRRILCDSLAAVSGLAPRDSP